LDLALEQLANDQELSGHPSELLVRRFSNVLQSFRFFGHQMILARTEGYRTRELTTGASAPSHWLDRLVALSVSRASTLEGQQALHCRRPHRQPQPQLGIDSRHP
jgi:hypothetical protein